MKRISICHLFTTVVLLLLATLASCSRDDEMPIPDDSSIRFDNQIEESFVEDLTKGTITTTDNLAEFGVFAYYTPDEYDAVTSTPNHMHNTHVTRTLPQGLWTYTPLNYWPQTGSVSFFAYTPYADGVDAGISVACTSGAPIVTYAVPDDVKAHRDLMLSAPTLNQKKQDGAVLLTFHHALACIDFSASVNPIIAGQSIKVIDISLGNFRYEASCHHEKATITQIFTSNDGEKEHTLSIAAQTLKDQSLTQDYAPITSDNSCPMLWPQTIDDTDKLTVTVEYSANNTTRTVVFVRDLQGFVPERELKTGLRYTFNLLFTPFADMTLTCGVVTEWDNKTIDVPDFN